MAAERIDQAADGRQPDMKPREIYALVGLLGVGSAASWVNPYFMPHGHCFLWQPWILWPYAIFNGIYAVSYLAVGWALLYSKRRWGEGGLLPARVAPIAGWFAIFCAASHVMAIVTIWFPVYHLMNLVLAPGAVISAIGARRFVGTVIHWASINRDAQNWRDLVRERPQEVSELMAQIDRARAAAERLGL